MRPFLDDYDGIFIGHTHIQHRARIDGRLIVNPGSVDQPRDGDPRAAYATYDTATDDLEFHRVDYPIQDVEREINAVGLPSESATRLYDGR
jgi:diadenosine tetraphosphatase ApaH/serine/threonine PP2A family protein phosphatase